MFDQSFSFNTISTVFMAANRNGHIRKDFLSKSYIDASREYHNLRTQLLELKHIPKGERTDDDLKNIKLIKERQAEIAVNQKKSLDKHLQEVVKKINNRNFRFTLTPKKCVDSGKTNYAISKTPEEFFAMQILCRNIKHTFNLEMMSRASILSQIKLLLGEDKHRKYLIRLDLENCFESIPHGQLFDLVENNTLLDFRNKAMLKGLICHEFENKNERLLVKEQHVGIPRGCAVSSYLAELYLSKIDHIIKRKLDNIVYYARYVDDIFMLVHPTYAPNEQKSIEETIDVIRQIFKSKGLTFSKEKTMYIDTNVKTDYSIEMLGYQFNVRSDQIEIKHSKKKCDKTRNRIKCIFKEFNRLMSIDYIKAKQYLFDAMRVLTANTELHSSKRGVKIGAFYSNQLLEDSSVLCEYDKYIKYMIDSISIPEAVIEDTGMRLLEEKKIKGILQKNAKFEKGFSTKKSFCISKHKLQHIRRSWS